MASPSKPASRQPIVASRFSKSPPACLRSEGFQGDDDQVDRGEVERYRGAHLRHFSEIRKSLYWAVIERKIDCAAPLERLLGELELEATIWIFWSRSRFECWSVEQDQTLSRLLLYSALESMNLSERFFRNYIRIF